MEYCEEKKDDTYVFFLLQVNIQALPEAAPAGTLWTRVALATARRNPAAVSAENPFQFAMSSRRPAALILKMWTKTLRLLKWEARGSLF